MYTTTDWLRMSSLSTQRCWRMMREGILSCIAASPNEPKLIEFFGGVVHSSKVQHMNSIQFYTGITPSILCYMNA